MPRSPSTSTPPVRRTQGERVAEARQRLFDAAVELILEQGYEATSAAEISLRAGFSRTMVHVRFGTKDDLLDQLLHERYEDRLIPEHAPDVPGLDQTLDVLDGLVALSETEPELLRAIFVLNFEAAGNATTLRPRTSAWIQRIEERVTAGLINGLADGSVDPAVDVARVARNTLNAGIGIAYTWIVLPAATDFAADVRDLRERIEREVRPQLRGARR